ncbi:MAG: subclass B3 metallo-beta-lactamase [Acidobacteria bacterium]|nr:subclass B3 metallo-beta-lactamase [Acidobacteriota bacterium]
MLLMNGAALSAQFRTVPDEELRRTGVAPVEPFRVIGNIYYVGTEGISAFLITTSAGHILLDTGYAEGVPVVRGSIEKLGFNLRDIELIINSHSHGDHVGGHALVKELTGAKVLSSAADAPAMARGGAREGSPKLFEIDQIIRDKQEITLGGVKLVAHLTPGHTPGCTTWTMAVEEGGKKYNVLFHCSTSFSEGVRLTGDPAHPTRGADFRKTFAALKSLPCDILFLPHGQLFDLIGKMRRLKNGEKPNPFIDPAGCRSYIEKAEREFLTLPQ